MYYEVWERFDEKATQYIAVNQLCEFVDQLEEPLRVPAPNLYKLVTMNIPICDGDRVHCVDILDALTKNFLGTADDEGGDLADIAPGGPERKDYHPIGSTLQRQRQIYCALVIQKAWRGRRNVASQRGDVEPTTAAGVLSDAVADSVRGAASVDGHSVVVDVGTDEAAND